ncbi:hypothetical protein BJ742DRAFT_782220 [Cladochytrium replicatum]|nr:hypothetical protein BJ742DRAFT_782220 [Cladochytrium replicatum]
MLSSKVITSLRAGLSVSMAARSARSVHVAAAATSRLSRVAPLYRAGILPPVMFRSQFRGMAESIVKVPNMAESITEGTLTQWHKKVGDYVERDELIATIETDKVDIPVNSPESGVVLELFAEEGSTVTVGGNLFKVDNAGEKPAGESPPAPEAPKPAAAPAPVPTPAPAAAAPAAASAAPPPQPKSAPAPAPVVVSAPKPPPPPPSRAAVAPPSQSEYEEIPGIIPGSRTERRVKMNRMRMRIAERLKESQSTAASLTTFNEVDMSNLIDLRKKYGELVQEKYGIKFGYMSAFMKAATYALQQVPAVNARIENDQIVYHDYVDISVAVATPKGLVTPVVRNTEAMNMIQIESAMTQLAKKARDNAITIEDMTGGTFTVSNGGVFGSLMGTPIINQPQSAILGMHGTKERAVVVNGQVVAKPMMYIALTYDHRLIDGREAVTFLVKLKEVIEDPRRLLLEV